MSAVGSTPKPSKKPSGCKAPPRPKPLFDYDSPEFTEALSRHIHAAKQTALSEPGFTLLPSEQSPQGTLHQPDYGSWEFTKKLARKFHQGTRKAIRQARDGGLLDPKR